MKGKWFYVLFVLWVSSLALCYYFSTMAGWDDGYQRGTINTLAMKGKKAAGLN